MPNSFSVKSALVLGVCLLAGLSTLGYLLGDSLIRFKEYERSVTVKGLAEREVDADIALWPIQFVKPHNDLGELYKELEVDADKITRFLQQAGFTEDEFSAAAPAITDKLADMYGNAGRVEFRYSARQTITVYTKNIEAVISASKELGSLGQHGIIFLGNDYGNSTEYLFTGLNALKPGMIEEATRNAREVAEKFAADSNSGLGKIKLARQGQFSISPRDSQTPHIKKVRVVSTIEYYLAD